jgi:hypothetical protein
MRESVAQAQDTKTRELGLGTTCHFVGFIEYLLCSSRCTFRFPGDCTTTTVRSVAITESRLAWETTGVGRIFGFRGWELARAYFNSYLLSSI